MFLCLPHYAREISFLNHFFQYAKKANNPYIVRDVKPGWGWAAPGSFSALQSRDWWLRLAPPSTSPAPPTLRTAIHFSQLRPWRLNIICNIANKAIIMRVHCTCTLHIPLSTTDINKQPLQLSFPKRIVILV